MRLFFVASNLPSPGHSIRGATVVVREALRAVAGLGHDVTFQPLPVGGPFAASGEEHDTAITWAESQGFRVLPALHAPGLPDADRLDLVRQATFAEPERFYPAYALRNEMAARITASDCDAVFHLWSSAALAACATSERPVYAYFGNPDHKPLLARLKHPDLFDVPNETVRNRARMVLTRLANDGRRRANIRLMNSTRWAANVCAVDADFFEQAGHPDAFYVQNMWPSQGTEADARPDPTNEHKLVGNLGGLYGTGNTFGLALLGREIVPALERRLGNRFSVHVFGAGEPTSAVRRALEHPRIQVRGFVDDIDGELRSSQVFILANNNNFDFVVGHTRILHAWSLGLPLVGHVNTHAAMPDIVHGENALLGTNAEEIADLTVQLLEDAALRERIVAGATRTLEERFAPSVVMQKVLDRIAAGAAASQSPTPTRSR